MSTLVYDYVGFRALLRKHGGDHRAALREAVAVYGGRHGAVAAIASAAYWLNTPGVLPVEVALEAGADPTAVADAFNAYHKEGVEEHEEEMAGIRAIAHRL